MQLSSLQGYGGCTGMTYHCARITHKQKGPRCAHASMAHALLARHVGGGVCAQPHGLLRRPWRACLAALLQGFGMIGYSSLVGPYLSAVM